LQEQGCVFAHDFIELYNLDEANLKRDYDSEDEGDADAINFEGEEMFPSLGSDNASAVATFSSTDYGGALSMDFARAVSLNPPAAPVSLQYGGMNSAYPQAGASYPRSLYHKTTDALVGNKWVKTGSSVAAQYADLRENAYQMACARNKCFMSATRAYRK
jgi:hypothetical protein